jgi:hypothetical protein
MPDGRLLLQIKDAPFDNGYTQTCAKDIHGILEFMDAGASLGHLWLEGHFGLGDPLVNQGGPSSKGGKS